MAKVFGVEVRFLAADLEMAKKFIEEAHEDAMETGDFPRMSGEFTINDVYEIEDYDENATSVKYNERTAVAVDALIKFVEIAEANDVF